MSLRRTKGKAPPLPSETRYAENSPGTKAMNPANLMEQNENVINRDIDLTVVLPGGVENSTTVPGNKPMMDLLILLCGKYHLNPSSYTIELISADKNQVRYKSNTLIGTLEVEKVILKQKNIDDKNKKPTPVAPEQTIRLVINYKKSQKTVVRVSPRVPLRELVPAISEKCDFDPKCTVLLRDYQSQEPLNLTQSLTDLGLKELYAMDTSRVTSPAEFNTSPTQEELFQAPLSTDTLQRDKDGKGILGLFRRSKKKQDQTASAPATPSLNQQRPASMVRSNTHPTPYESSTLPSEMPKKRRAPLPPMVSSQSVPKDLGYSRTRPDSCTSQTSTENGSEQNPSGLEKARAGSFQPSGMTSLGSSLKRTKRKAPSPPPTPSKIVQEQNSSNSTEAVFVAESAEAEPSLDKVTSIIDTVKEECDIPVTTSSPKGNSADVDRAQVLSAVGTAMPAVSAQCLVSTHSERETMLELPDEANLSANTDTPDTSEISHESGIGLEYSIEEMNEQEETSTSDKEDSECTPLKIQQEVPMPYSYNVSSNTGKNEPASESGPADVLSSENASKSTEEEKQMNLSTAGKELCDDVVRKASGTHMNEKATDLEDVNLNENIDHEGLPSYNLTANTQTKNVCHISAMDSGRIADVPKTAEANGIQVEESISLHEDSLSHQSSKKRQDVLVTVVELREHNPNECTTEDKTENVQEMIISDAVDLTYDRTTSRSDFLQGSLSSRLESKGHVHFSDIVNTSPPAASNEEQNEHTKLQLSPGEQEHVIDNTLLSEDRMLSTNTIHMAAEDTTKSQSCASVKRSPLYKQDSEPKPKPSNEITRDYIPKIGMTTYKIVPQKSFEQLKSFDSETMEDVTKPNETVCSHHPDISSKPEVPQKPKVIMGIPSSTQISNQSASNNKSEASVVSEDSTGIYSNSNSSDTTVTPGKCVSENEAETTASIPQTVNQQTAYSVCKLNPNTETKGKQNAPGVKMKPGSFYLQLLKRTPGYYVTSAAAKNATTSTTLPTSPPPVANPVLATSPPPASPSVATSPPPPVSPPLATSPPPSASPILTTSPPPSARPTLATSPPPSPFARPPLATSPPLPSARPPLATSPPLPPPPPSVATSPPPPFASPPIATSPAPSTSPSLTTSPPPPPPSSPASFTSVCLNDSKNKEAERAALPSVGGAVLPPDEIFPPPPEFAENANENTQGGDKSEHYFSVDSSATESSRTLRSCNQQPALVNIRNHRTYAAPRPYSCTAPSAFALAVSSAVKRSQSFGRGSSIKSQLPRVTSTSTSVPVTSTEQISSFVENSDKMSKPNQVPVASNISLNGKSTLNPSLSSQVQ